MAAVDLKECQPLEGSGQVAQAANKREKRTIVGRAQKIWLRLTRPVFRTDQGLPGRVSPERPPTAKAQPREEPPPRPPANENTVKSVKPSPPGKDRLRLLTLDELEVLPDPEWQIEGILPQGGLAVLYGEPGAGKSFLALDWALSIATGQPWLGRQVRSGTVIYVYAEGASGLKFRVRAWAMERGDKPRSGDKPGNILILPHSLDMRSPGEVAELKKAIGNEGGGPMLIVIDTLARCFGTGDENAPKDMIAFVAGADKLREAFPGATVLVVHHSGKDPKRGDRGHTALRAAADAVMRLSNSKGQLTLQCEKQKDAEEFEAIHMRLCSVDLGNGRSSCVLKKASGSTRLQDTDPRAQGTDKKALEALSSFGAEGATFTEWREKSCLHKSTFKDVLGRLLKRGAVVKAGKKYVVAQLGTGAGTGPEQGCPAAA